jgi:rhomboid protease GluP
MSLIRLPDAAPLPPAPSDREPPPPPSRVSPWAYPETEGPDPGPAWATPVLVGLNGAVFVAMALAGANLLNPDVPTLLRWGANAGLLTLGGQWWRLLTSMFLHIGLIHLAFNMAVLWGIGRFLERLLGQAGFLVVYLLAGLCGSLASLAWNPEVVSAGASGAIFGLYGALLGFLLRERRNVVPEARKRLTRSALAFVGYNFVFGLAIGHVDLAAHLGGLAGGFLCGYAVALPQTAAGRSRRFRVNVRVLTVGLLASGALALALPASFLAQLEPAQVLERQALGAYNGAVSRVQAGKLTDAGFADLIETQVIPVLRASRMRLQAIHGVPRSRVRLVEALQASCAAREAAFEHAVQGLRKGDGEALRGAMGELAEADRRLKADLPPN